MTSDEIISMMQNFENIAQVQIRADSEGIPRVLSLVRSPFIERLTSGTRAWQSPIVLHGSSREEEFQKVDSITFNDRRPMYVNDLRDFINRQYRRLPSGLMNDLMDFSYRSSRSRFDDASQPMTSAPISKHVLLNIAEKSLSRHDYYVVADEVSVLEDEIERLCQSSAISMRWNSSRSLLPSYVASVWLEKSRPWPLIIDSNKELLSKTERWENFSASRIEFNALCRSIAQTMNVTEISVSEAYKVWQLSRGGSEEKTTATIPNVITIPNAQQFLNVFVGARPKVYVSNRAPQVAAPIIFDFSDDKITLRTSLQTRDVNRISQIAAHKIHNHVVRILEEHSISNAIPASTTILKDVAEDLESIKSGNFDDGIIVGIGLQFRALQYQIDQCKDRVDDLSLGDLAGLFAISHLFLNRFPIWQEYDIASSVPENSPESVIEYRLSRLLLRNAERDANLMGEEARERTSRLLATSSVTENPSPSTLDGVVRSSDNLAAIALSRVSRVAAGEAREFGNKLKDESYKEASKGIISFVSENADTISKLASSRSWSWAGWAISVIKNIMT